MTTLHLLPTRPLATLQLTGLSVSTLIEKAQAVLTSMTGNPAFSTPTPPLTSLGAGITALVTAQTAAVARTHGAVAARNEKVLELLSVLEQLRTYVQGVADTSGAAAASVIESAGMTIRKRPARPPRVFSAQQGPVSGTVIVRAASAGRRASYEWQSSVDGGKTWVSLPPTLQARTTLTGLPPQTVLELKYRAVIRTGALDWSAPIAITVS